MRDRARRSAVAALTSTIEQPGSAAAERLTAPERELLATLTPALHAAIGEYERQRTAALEDVRQVAEATQRDYPGGTPSIAVDRRQPAEPTA